MKQVMLPIVWISIWVVLPITSFAADEGYALVKVTRGKHTSFKVVPKQKAADLASELKATDARIKGMIEARKADFKRMKSKKAYTGYVPREPSVEVLQSDKSESKLYKKREEAVKKLLEGTTVVELMGKALRDTLLDSGYYTNCYGDEGRDIRLRQAQRKTASVYLIKAADIKKACGGKEIIMAELTMHEWDPCNNGDTKFVVLPMLSAWTEADASWQKASENKKWANEKHFALGFDTGLVEVPTASFVTEKDDETGTADPPIPHVVDITPLVQRWAAGELPNHGVVVAPIHEEEISDGISTRVQFRGREFPKEEEGPIITLYLR